MQSLLRNGLVVHPSKTAYILAESLGREMRPFGAFRALLWCALSLIICATLVVVVPGVAQALTTERWTAKSNQDGGTNIMGATATRITWQGKADAGEQIKSVTLNLPEGTSLQDGGTTVTVLDGLSRLNIDSKAIVDGSNVSVDFSEPTPAGTIVMVELNNAMFPSDGGSMQITGSYTDGMGAAHDVPESSRPIDVVSTSAVDQLSSWLAQQPWVQAWNSNKFLHLFFDPTIVVTSVPAVFWGWLLALGLVAASFPLAIPIGLMWALCRMSKRRILRAIASVYINVVRGTPLFLQIYIAFFGLPLLGIAIDNFVLGIIVLVMNSSAYQAEIFRAGIQSINKGQFEAARSLGMNGAQTMIYVIIPQTFRRVIPTMTSEFILLYKDTSLLAAVGVMEIMMFAKTITAATGNVTPYIVAACFYLVVTIPLTHVINNMEARLINGTPKTRQKK